MTEPLTETITPRIYVACLAAYNNGILHGAWIDAAQEPWAIWAEIVKMLDASPIAGAEEHAIHDHEGFEGARIEEHTSIKTVAALAVFIAAHGALASALLNYYGGDLAEARAAIEERHHGRYDNLAHYAQELTEASVPIPEALACYIDYDAMAHDWELSGELITIDCDGGIEVFGCA